MIHSQTGTENAADAQEEARNRLSESQLSGVKVTMLSAPTTNTAPKARGVDRGYYDKEAN